MALAEDIRALRDRTLADLDAAYEYYIDTKTAWKLVREIAALGYKFSVRNPIAGTLRTEADLADKAQEYVARQLPEVTFQQFISIFENFLFDLLRAWLTAYPQSLGGKQVPFKSILDTPDKDAITQFVVARELRVCPGRVDFGRASLPASRNLQAWVARQEPRSPTSGTGSE